MSYGEQYTQRVIPSGLAELIVYLNHKPKLALGNRTLEDSILLNGQQTDYYDLLISEDLSIFSISFQPQGLSRFFSLPISELLNRDVALQQINKQLYSELESRLSVSMSFRQRVEIAEACFIRLLRNNTREWEFRRIDHCIQAIRRYKGLISIDHLASDVCLSRKQFERVFAEYIGISPKQYLKIIRLQAAIHMKSKDNTISLTGLAYENGYYDQSHFIHDFRTMTGLTPGQFFEDCDDLMSDFFD